MGFGTKNQAGKMPFCLGKLGPSLGDAGLCPLIHTGPQQGADPARVRQNRLNGFRSVKLGDRRARRIEGNGNR